MSESSRSLIKSEFIRAKNEINEFGGLSSFKNGDWLFRLISKSFKNYVERANVEYFQNKYKSTDPDLVISKLTKVTAKNSMILGAIVGTTVSTDEIIALITAGEGGIGLPANIAIAFTAIAGEALLLTKFQLQLIANISKIYNVPLDPDDPEDILTILAFTLGGSAAEVAGKAGMKIGSKATEKLIKKYVSKNVLESLKSVGKKIGIKILQRTMIKYSIPLASMGIGAGWNYTSVKTVSKIARKHFIQREEELA